MSARRYTLFDDSSSFELKYDPKNWAEIVPKATRSKEFIGVFRQFVYVPMQFVDPMANPDACKWLSEKYQTEGTEAEIWLRIDRKTDYEDAYEEEFFGSGNLGEYILDWENFTPSITIDFEDSGFIKSFMNRKDQVVNMGLTTDLEGNEMTAIPQQTLFMHQRDIQNVTKFNTEEGAEVTITVGDTNFFGLNTPLDIVTSDIDAAREPYALTNQEDSSFFLDNSNGEKLEHYSINGTLDIEIINTPTAGSGNTRVVLRKFKSFNRVGGSGNYFDYDETILHAFSDTTFPSFIRGEKATVLINEEIDLVPSEIKEANDYLALQLSVRFEGAHDTYGQKYTNVSIDVNNVEFFEATTALCQYRHDTWSRMVEIVTGEHDAFRSDVLGGIDTWPRTYTEDGKYQNHIQISGKQIRKFDIFPDNSIKKLLQTDKSIFNLGIGIEQEGLKNIVRLEDFNYFLDGEVGTTIHNISKPSFGVAKEFTYSGVNVGYKESEFEAVNGLTTPHNKPEYATHIKSSVNVLNLIAEDRADNIGAELARRKNITIAGTEDTRYDKKNWIMEVLRNGDQLVLRKDEGFDVVENIFSPSTAYNLNLQPARNLLRNGNKIKACLLKYPNQSVRFTSSNRESDLLTQKPNEEAVQENADIINSRLDSPRHTNNMVSFEAPLNAKQFAEMYKNRRKLIKFSPNNEGESTYYGYGWLLEVEGGGEGRKAKIKVLWANVYSPNLNIIDPDGTDLPPLPPEVPVEIGGFNYLFNFVLG